MATFANRKILLQVASIGIVLTQYDAILHSIVLFLHYVFEWVELALEEFIEHLFHTNRQQTQVIVFYLLVFLGMGLLYRVWLTVPNLYGRLKSWLMDIGLQWKLLLANYWLSSSLTQKAKWLATFVLSLYGLLLMAF